VPNLLRDVRMK